MKKNSKMKRIIKNTVYSLLLFSTITVWSQDQFIADSQASKVNWKGFKPTGEHFGTVTVKSGSFTIKNSMIVNGEFQIDMNSIVVLDIPSDESSNAKLVRHLKSNDFFNAKNHPFATFKINSSEPNGSKTLVKGDLTIKNITHAVSFLADVTVDEETVILKSENFEIDRSKWDIKFKSQSFFSDLGDKFISDDMELSVDVRAVK